MTPQLLDLGALRAAIASFEDGPDVVEDAVWFRAQSPRVRNTMMAGEMQNFEFVYEIGCPGDLDSLNFRDVPGLAGEAGPVDDVAPWFEYRAMRDITAHTYDQEKARQVYLGALRLRGDARALRARLEVRGG